MKTSTMKKLFFITLTGLIGTGLFATQSDLNLDIKNAETNLLWAIKMADFFAKNTQSIIYNLRQFETPEIIQSASNQLQKHQQEIARYKNELNSLRQKKKLLDMNKRQRAEVVIHALNNF